jgi:hypothetical protein
MYAWSNWVQSLTIAAAAVKPSTGSGAYKDASDIFV